jgi:hypothetical protein
MGRLPSITSWQQRGGVGMGQREVLLGGIIEIA